MRSLGPLALARTCRNPRRPRRPQSKQRSRARLLFGVASVRAGSRRAHQHWPCRPRDAGLTPRILCKNISIVSGDWSPLTWPLGIWRSTMGAARPWNRPCLHRKPGTETTYTWGLFDPSCAFRFDERFPEVAVEIRVRTSTHIVVRSLQTPEVWTRTPTPPCSRTSPSPRPRSKSRKSAKPTRFGQCLCRALTWPALPVLKFWLMPHRSALPDVRGQVSRSFRPMLSLGPRWSRTWSNDARGCKRSSRPRSALALPSA